jgi:hypothetical protein
MANHPWTIKFEVPSRKNTLSLREAFEGELFLVLVAENLISDNISMSFDLAR